MLKMWKGRFFEVIVDSVLKTEYKNDYKKLKFVLHINVILNIAYLHLLHKITHGFIIVMHLF